MPLSEQSLRFISLQEGLMFNRQLPGFIHLPAKPVVEPTYEDWYDAEEARKLREMTAKREAVLV